MALRADALAGARFDVRLGPGALGFMEETLLYEQLRARGARSVFVPEAAVVHHFNSVRLDGASFVRRAYLQGRGEGWMFWQWGHQRYTLRNYAHWLRLELKLLQRGGQRRFIGTDDDLALVREIGRRREYTRTRWLTRRNDQSQ